MHRFRFRLVGSVSEHEPGDDRSGRLLVRARLEPGPGSVLVLTWDDDDRVPEPPDPDLRSSATRRWDERLRGAVQPSP